MALIILVSTTRPCPAATILLDPGHGGDDKGVVGGSAYFEKQFTLALAQKIAQLLSPDHRIEMTRTADVTVPIPDRAGMANHLNAEMMISLHVAVAPYCNDRRAAIYFHDDERLVFQTTIPIQSRLGESGPALTDWSKLQVRHHHQSQHLATLIRQSLLTGGEFDEVTICSAPLVALMGADLPAVLIEVGCIHPSTAETESEIDQKTDKYAQSIANAINLAATRLQP